MTEEVSDIYGGEKSRRIIKALLLLANIHSVSDSCNAVSDDYRGLCLNHVAQFLPITVEFISSGQRRVSFHGLCADSVDLGSVLSFVESAAEVAVYFSRAVYILMLYSVFSRIM